MMRRTVRIARRAAVALAAAALAVPLTGPGVAQAIGPDFVADSGDSCPYGVTRGSIDWIFAGGRPRFVIGADVVGSLLDRPVPTQPSLPCADDRRFSVGTFTAFFTGGRSQAEAIRVDNGTVPFRFRLGGNAVNADLERIVIQVCRHPVSQIGPPSYCGPTQVYLAP
jgi:hypothetical protein